MKFIILALTILGLPSLAFADNAPSNEEMTREIPTAEHAFVDSIPYFDKAKIVALIGEPSFKADSTDPDTGKIDASVWRYHYLNTNESGEYYQTTELDFVEDQVAVIVFMNNDGEDVPNDAVIAKPSKKPDL